MKRKSLLQMWYDALTYGDPFITREQKQAIARQHRQDLRSTVSPAKQPSKALVPTKRRPVIVHPCDACHHGTARFEIITHKGRPLYLCGHHRHAHRAHIDAKDYTVRELKH